MSPASAVVYWLSFAAVGAALSFAANSSADMGSHGGSNAALGMWILSMMVSGGSLAVGGIFAIFRKARDIGIAFVAAGIGGLITGGLFALSWMSGAR